MFRSLPRREAQRVAAALEGLRRARQRAEPATGTPAGGFIEARAGGLRMLYRIERQALKVALLAQARHARVREFPAPPG